MSIQVANIDTTGVVVGNVKKITFPAPPGTIMAQMVPAATQQAQLHVYNESPVGWQAVFPQTNKQFTIPAGAWAKVYIPANETELDLTAQYVITSPVVNKLLADYYYANEPNDEIAALGNSPVGVSSTTTTQLIATPSAFPTGFEASQIDPLSGFLDPAVLTLFPFTGGLGNVYPPGPDLNFATIDGNGVLRPALEVPSVGAGLIIWGLSAPATYTQVVSINSHGAITKLANLGTVGLGVAAQRANADGTLVTATTQQTIVSLTTPNDGARHRYRVGGRVRVNNGVSGNTITFRCSYTDFDTAGSAGFYFAGNAGSADITFGGVTSISNNVYACTDRAIDCAANTLLSVFYTDPTNTPSDNVSATIEQLT